MLAANRVFHNEASSTTVELFILVSLLRGRNGQRSADIFFQRWRLVDGSDARGARVLSASSPTPVTALLRRRLRQRCRHSSLLQH